MERESVKPARALLTSIEDLEARIAQCTNPAQIVNVTIYNHQTAFVAPTTLDVIRTLVIKDLQTALAAKLKELKSL